MQKPVTVLIAGGEESAGAPLARALADADFRVLASTFAGGAAACNAGSGNDALLSLAGARWAC